MTADPHHLSGLLRNLLVSVEKALERVPLEEIAFPCPVCGEHDPCSCHHHHLHHHHLFHQPQGHSVEKRDSSIQTSPTYEMDSSIPHIDSDDEHDPHSLVGGKPTLIPAQRLSDIAESYHMAGICLPGLHDSEGRALVVVDGDSLLKSSMCPLECAKVLHYYTSIPARCERRRCDVCLIGACNSTEALNLLDNSLSLVTPHVNITRIILFVQSEFLLHNETSCKLPSSKVMYILARTKEDLSPYLAEDQIPELFGGNHCHDQVEWIEFFKEAEDMMLRCQECGKRMVEVMSELGSGEGTRRGAVQETRALARVIADPELLRLRREGPAQVERLQQRSQWLKKNLDVRLMLERAERLFNEIESTSQKLEEISEKRREKLKDIARIRNLETESEQVLAWLSHKGDDWLKRHAELANTLPAIKQQEQDFEKFYFISMRHLDKGSDLLEEVGQCTAPGSSGLRDLARNLKNHLRGFSDRLEDTRERLEDTSRCFYLLDRAYEWALEAMKYMSRVKPEESTNPEPSLKQLKQYLMAHPPPPPEHFTEMVILATKLENEKLLQQCKVAQARCEETIEQVRSLLGSEPVRWCTSTPIAGRRKSLPCQTGACCQEDWGRQPLQHITEECLCTPAPLQRSSTWQYPTDGYDDEDKLSSSADNTTEGSDAGTKSCEDMEEHSEPSSTMSPIPVNSHLHCELSVEVDGPCGTQTLKTKKTMLLIMKEMIQTERDYVRSLEYVIENYIPELLREDIPQALRGQRNVVFGNIEKIFEFHSHYFLHELEKCEQNPLQVGKCFLRHEKKFYLYALYNKNKPKSDALMSEYGTAFFKAKQLELGDKMDLASYLLKPVQRMGKYALLLQQLMKASRQEVMELRDAENMVRFQLRHGNDLLAMDSLRDCDVNVKEQGRLLRQNEFLVWQGKGGKKYYRHVFLFEELILFSKARRFPDNKNLDLYIYKHSIKTSDIGLTAKVGDSTTKFEIWFRKRKPNDTFTLQSISEDIKQAWTEELSNLLWKQALKNREIRLAEMSSMGIGNKPCLDIRPSANQISDRSISIAQLSKTAPRFRNSIAVSPVEQTRNKRPISIISVTSSSGGSSSSSTASISSSSSGGERRQHSHCSSAESGIVSDWNTSSSVSSDTNTSPHHAQLSVKL